MSEPEHTPLPISKHRRVQFEAIRTGAACLNVVIGAVVLARVFGWL